MNSLSTSSPQGCVKVGWMFFPARIAPHSTSRRFITSRCVLLSCASPFNPWIHLLLRAIFRVFVRVHYVVHRGVCAEVDRLITFYAKREGRKKFSFSQQPPPLSLHAAMKVPLERSQGQSIIHTAPCRINPGFM